MSTLNVGSHGAPERHPAATAEGDPRETPDQHVQKLGVEVSKWIVIPLSAPLLNWGHLSFSKSSPSQLPIKLKVISVIGLQSIHLFTPYIYYAQNSEGFLLVFFSF